MADYNVKFSLATGEHLTLFINAIAGSDPLRMSG